MTQFRQFAAILALAFFIANAAAGSALSAESWQASFDDICSKVDVSGSMSVEELASLIERLDKLLPEIQASKVPSKKIYLQRLKRCRSMFQFMIDTKTSSES